MTNTFTATGSHGELTVNADTGTIIEYRPHRPGDPDGYDKITRLDVIEWMIRYPDERLAGTTVDILDMGLWSIINGVEVYDKPDNEWRRQWRR